MASLFTGGKFQALNALGVVPGARLYTYAAGIGLTPLATYTLQDGDSENTNPVVCDANGQANVWLGSSAYRMILKDASDVTIWDVDNILNDSGFTQVGAGAVARSIQSKLEDTVSVYDFGAVGDGVTDDTDAIQAAVDTRKTVFFPKPTDYYRCESRVFLYANSHLCGEEGVNTIIRRTTGANGVFEFVGGNENAIIENLRIGGAGVIGIAVDNVILSEYLSTLTLRNVHFEADLLKGIYGNLIHCNFEDCTFGYFMETAANANFQAVVSVHSGGNTSNVNRFENCKFVNGGVATDAVSFDNGLILSFENCAWEFCGRNLVCSNVQNTLLLNCYTEGGTSATSQFAFNQSRGRMKVIGGQFDGSLMPASSAMFQVSDDAQLYVEDADISTTASAYTYVSATTASHTPADAAINEHRFSDCRIQGNTSDPLKYLDTTRSAALTSKGWAIINTASSGSIVASSDPGLAITRHGTGDVTCTFSTNLASTATKVCAVVTGQTTIVIAAGTGDNTVRVKSYLISDGTTATDGIFMVNAWGA